jgi:hypothetical protein
MPDTQQIDQLNQMLQYAESHPNPANDKIAMQIRDKIQSLRAADFDKYINAPVEDLPDYQFLAQYLKGGIEKGLPYKDQLLQTSTGAIRGQYDTASRNLADSLSSRGVGGSGIGLVAQNQLQGQESSALNQVTTNINAQDIQFRQDAIARLLGLSTSQASYGLNQKSQSLGALQYLYGAGQQDRQFQTEINQRERAQEMKFWSDLLGSAGQVAGAYYFHRPGQGGEMPGYNYAGSDATMYG